MTFTAPHNVLSILGTIDSSGQPEAWSIGLRFAEGNYLMGGAVAGAPDAATGPILQAIEDDLGTWWGSLASVFPTNVKHTGFKFNAVDVNGRYINQTETFEKYRAVPLGGSAAGMIPPQCSTVVTFRTDAARGLANRGRVFLPPLSTATVTAQGRLNFTPRDSIATATAQLLTDLSNWPSVDFTVDPGRVCVMSKVLAGATRRVNRVDVGDVFDTMRSRRESLQEKRSLEVAVTS